MLMFKWASMNYFSLIAWAKCQPSGDNFKIGICAHCGAGLESAMWTLQGWILLLALQQRCILRIHVGIPFAQLHFFGSWRWAPGQPPVLPVPVQGKEPGTSPWDCVAARRVTWSCLLSSCWPTICLADRRALQPHSVVGSPHWGS